MDSSSSFNLIRRWRNWWKTRHFARDSISTRYALVEACLIGIFSADRRGETRRMNVDLYSHNEHPQTILLTVRIPTVFK